MSRTETPHRVRDGARVIAPFAVAVGAFGVTFGVLARDAGLGGLRAIVFSATTFAGSAQFAATSVLSAGGTLAAAIAAAVLLNTRYIPIGLSVAPSLRGPAWKRGLRAQLVVDESWAVSHLGGGRYDPRLLLGAGLTLYCAWVAGTTARQRGRIAARRPETLGLDAAFPALFLALLAGQVHGRTGVVAAIGGALVAAALVPFVPPACRSWPRRSCASSACGARRPRPVVTRAWVLIAVVGACTIALKGLGPLVIGGRSLPRPLLGVVALLAPTLLAALIVTQAFADGRHLVIDARAAGLSVALVAVLLRAPVLVVVVLAASTAALARAVA